VAVVTAATPWGTTATADIFVTADLIVASNRGGAFGLYQIRPDSPDTLLPLLVDGGGDVQAVRSPNRTRIAFSSSRSGSYDLYVMDADGGNPRRITVDPGSEGEPAWTPDGARLVYTAAPRGGIPQLVSVRADGSEPRPLTASPGGNRSPEVSPDGRRVAFVSTRDGNSEIYETDIDGGEARRITKTSERESSPSYLPNGDLIFVVEKGSKSRLMRLPAGGATPMPLLEIDQPVVALDVSRDGERIAYGGAARQSREGEVAAHAADSAARRRQHPDARPAAPGRAGAEPVVLSDAAR
jgi:Tol biopolymer transport system component